MRETTLRAVRSVVLASGEFPWSESVLGGVLEAFDELDASPDDECIVALAVPKKLALMAHGWCVANEVDLHIYEETDEGIAALLADFKPTVGNTIIRRPLSEAARLMCDIGTDSHTTRFGIDDWVVSAHARLEAADVQFHCVMIETSQEAFPCDVCGAADWRKCTCDPTRRS